jgi:hypothetical protein
LDLDKIMIDPRIIQQLQAQAAPRMQQSRYVWDDKTNSLVDTMQQQQAQQPQQRGGGPLGFIGDIVGGVVTPFAKFANQGIQQQGQVLDTGKMLLAQATGNTDAWHNANLASQERLKQFKDTGGILNKGTITNEEETRGGTARGAGKIIGTTAQIGATIAPVGKAASLGMRAAQTAGTGALYGGGEAMARGGSLEDTLTGAAQGGAVGGFLGAGPLNLLRGAGGATKAAVMGDDVVSAATRAANKPFTRRAGQALTGAADDLAIKNFRLTPSQLANYKSKFGEDAGQTIRKYGFSSADDVATKGIQPLQQQFDEAITGITGVTKDSLKKNFEKRINQLSTAGPSDTKAIGVQLKKEANGILKQYGDVVDANELNMIRRQFDDLVNYTEKTANPARYGVNKRMADAIRETLQGADQTGTLKNLGRELQKLRQLEGNVLKQDQLGRGSLPLNLPTLLGGNMGAAAGGPVGMAGMALGTAAVNSPTGRRLTMQGVGALGNKLTSAGGNAVRGGAARKAATIGTLELNNSMAQQQAQPEQPPTDLESSLLQQGMGQPQLPLQDANPYSRENLMADIQRDPENASDYIKYYSMLSEVFNPQGAAQKPMSGEVQKRALTAESGLRSLDTLDQTLQSDPGAFQRQALPNPLGITAGLTGTTDVRAATDNVVDVIARLRSGAAITDEEARRFSRFLPLPGDSQEAAMRKLQMVRQELSSFANPQQMGGSSLEDMLVQQAY